MAQDLLGKDQAQVGAWGDFKEVKGGRDLGQALEEIVFALLVARRFHINREHLAPV